ncbi:oxygen-independent coproporphyrinogen III oxidase [Marinibaculum pumilum]|uniref:Coproporphyrinogen-III oxidase n=1 Tax=Marinibaculum pumilum TaxID=1766165 RepID=A0ABV7L319_9PROT
MRTDLAARYGDERLPRYTSYPTAPHFSAAIGYRDYAEWLEELEEGLTGSLYFHVPFCRAMCWYCGCNTTVARRDGPVLDFLYQLRGEVALIADRLPRRLAVQHVHFGGGTPTILPADEFKWFVDLLRTRFDLADKAEIAIEIDPRSLSKEMAGVLGAAGVTRASLGVQCFDPAVQAAINRRQSVAQTVIAADRLWAAGVTALNVDLLYGLPQQTVAACVETVRACLPLQPSRFSVFGYAHVPGFKKHQQKIRSADLPDGPVRHAQAEAIAAVLQEAGYRRIGMDHFALPADPMARAHEAGLLRRNFQGYTTDDADALLGFGPSAIGRLPQGYVQNDPVRGRYARRIGAGLPATARGIRISREDRCRAVVIERLMCDFEVDLGQVCRAHGTRADTLLRAADRLPALQADGVVRLQGDRISIPPEARFLVRNVAAAFDSHLAAAAGRHSRAV